MTDTTMMTTTISTSAKCECGNNTDLKRVCVGGSYEGNAYEIWCGKCIEKSEEEHSTFNAEERVKTVLDLWNSNRIDTKTGGIILTDDDKQRHQIDRLAIQTAKKPKDVVASVYTINPDGTVELDLPLSTPTWLKNRELSCAKNHERYSKVARRLQMKLLAKGKTKSDLNSLKSF